MRGPSENIVACRRHLALANVSGTTPLDTLLIFITHFVKTILNRFYSFPPFVVI